MKTLRLFLSLFLLLCASNHLIAQSSPLPDYVKLKDESDYANYKTDVLNCVDWLEKRELNTQNEETKKVESFLVNWMMGAPDVTISMYAYVGDYTKANPEMLIFFMAGWTKYSLNNPNEKDDFKLNMEGVKEMIKVYQAGNGVKKDKKMDKLVALTGDQLEEFVKKQLAKK